MVNTVRVFAYGTLRMDWEGYSPTMSAMAPKATSLCDTMGAFRLADYGLWVEHAGSVPAVKARPGCHVIGDVFTVDMMGFRRLLRYESFPSGYDFEEAKVTDLDGDEVGVVVFTHPYAHRFGQLARSGDYFRPNHVPYRDPTPQEV